MYIRDVIGRITLTLGLTGCEMSLAGWMCMHDVMGRITYFELADWLAGWLAGWLAVSLAVWPHGWLACWLGWPSQAAKRQPIF